MAELKNEELLAKIAELESAAAAKSAEHEAAKSAAEAKAAELEAAKIAAEAKAAELSVSLNTIPNAPKKVDATFFANVVVDGKPAKRKFGFRDGAVRLRFSNGLILPTELVCRLAAGGKATPEEQAAHYEISQVLKLDGSDNGNCKAHLQHLVDIGFGELRPL